MVIARLVLDQGVVACATISMHVYDLARARESTSTTCLVTSAPLPPSTDGTIDGTLIGAALAGLRARRASLTAVVGLTCDGAESILCAATTCNRAWLPCPIGHDAVDRARFCIAGLNLKLAWTLRATVVRMTQNRARALTISGAASERAGTPRMPCIHLAIDRAWCAHALA